MPYCPQHIFMLHLHMTSCIVNLGMPDSMAMLGLHPQLPAHLSAWSWATDHVSQHLAADVGVMHFLSSSMRVQLCGA